MRIRILTSRGGFPCGAVVDVPDDEARAWVGVGDAERVEPAPEPATETAMQRKGKRR